MPNASGPGAPGGEGVLVPLPAGATAARFSPDGTLAAAGSSDGAVRLFRVEWAGAAPALRPLGTLKLHVGGVNDVAWAPDSRHVASAGDDKVVVLWSVARLRALRVLRGHTHAVTGVRFNHRGTVVVSASVDESVRLWDAKGGRALRTLAAHSEAVTAADVSFDGTLLASGAHDGLIRLWDTQSGHCLRTLSGAGPTAPITHLGFSPNAQFVVASTVDGHTRVWDYLMHECVKDYDTGAPDTYARTFVFVGGALLRAAADGVDVWDIQGQRAGRLAVPGGAFTVDAAAAPKDTNNSSSTSLCILAAGPRGLTLFGPGSLPSSVQSVLAAARPS